MLATTPIGGVEITLVIDKQLYNKIKSYAKKENKDLLEQVEEILLGFFDENILITINEFAERISASLTTARILANSSMLCDRGISVNIRPDNKYSSVRIHWKEYLKFTKMNPAVSQDKRYVSKDKFWIAK